ncbi:MULTISPECIES: hypothetical protein [Mycolicibacterium]|jgi:hypothetical protein|uniref:Uncharacterized protein n=3 Tax=Mycolicibacterium TaxID=1866885 RepID=A0AAE5AFD8_MYCFO|nr:MULTISPECIES: hypothetical protein [Mycolicibacterium]KLI04504.1 hypothetical protein AA982_29380 [Mycolicibacterium senegalense]KLO53852.1 hypothetical protein ABW05_22550 [Mycolicibacterium senegalense]KMV16336.1 hypothetical protein ACT17_20415 [Mycolicibacterium conceptionense]MDV7194285.1 hypothetical protein [Mycolicibacterium fortuitum]MDV7294296.1 hypothetical protein [Mycolicibacterium fortuitum]
MQVAMLRDERLRQQFQKHLAAQGDTPSRPELAGFTREVHELHKVHVTLTQLLRATTRNMAIPLPAGPVYPAERWAVEQGEAELAELDADIATAMKPLVLSRKRR